jgi:hypothetical protein
MDALIRFFNFAESQNANVQPYLRAWIQNFLTDRHLALTINGHQTGPFPLTRLRYIKFLTLKIKFYHVMILMLAVSGSSPSDVQSKLQQAVSQQTTLANKYQIKFSKSKTEISYFFLPNNIDRSSLTISINNITYTPQSSIRYLGAWLDNSLDCQTHITHRIGPARDIIKKLARLTTNGRTLHPHSAIRAIKAVFIPKLLYGIELFWKIIRK